MPVDRNKDVGLKFGEWEIIETLGKGKVMARCSCGTVKEVYKKSLVEGKTKSCGCMRNANFRKTVLDDLTGQKFGDWTIIEELGHGRVMCRCSCGTVRECQKAAVKNGTTRSCGCKQAENMVNTTLANNNTVGNKYGTLTIIKELGSGQVECICDCGNTGIFRKQNLVSGHTRSCGCKTNELKRESSLHDYVGTEFGYWTVLEDVGHNLVRCRCKCGTERILRKDIIVQGKSKSCGCRSNDLMRDTLITRYGEVSSNKISKPREAWQIEAISSRDNLVSFINNNFSTKPTIGELSEILDVNNANIGRKILEYSIEEYIQKNPLQSYCEQGLLRYIREITQNKYEIKTNCRGIIGKLELDIYIPELKIAFEFNGSYWHSSVFKNKRYHQNKTMECMRLGIRLIHIFEYEWVNKDKHILIKQYIKSILCRESLTVLHARNTEIRLVEPVIANQFLDKNHLQLSINSPINIGCYYNNNLVGVMTFGKPRFNSDYEYELHRLCWDSNLIVVGGSEKLFKFFVDNNNPQSVITYSDLSKFTGNIYVKLGFSVDEITSPGYCWVASDNSTISRIKSQKHKLIEAGLGTESMTEDEIMESLGYFKVYDAGSMRFIWKHIKNNK